MLRIPSLTSALTLLLVVAMPCAAGPGCRMAVASPVPDEPVVETVADGYRFTEGPALAPDGSIYFSDIPNNAIHRYDPATEETTLFTDDSGGANGLKFDAVGLVACAGKSRRIQRYSSPVLGFAMGDEPITLLSRFEGKSLNSPNDLVVHQTGAILFTDPRYGSRDDLELEVEAVYAARDPGPFQDTDDGEHLSAVMIDDLVRPNGIGLSPDHRTLYVNDNGAKRVMAYPLDEGGRRDGDGVLFHDVSDLGGPDGMTVDAFGRVYVAIYDRGVLVLTPDGKQRLGFIETGPKTTNCTFGADGRALYVTAEGALKRVELETGVVAEAESEGKSER